MQTVPGFHDDYLTRHNEQRYLLQLGFVDRLLGRLLDRLERTGMYDHTLRRRDRRPRLRLAGGRGDAPQRPPLERRGADPRAALRERSGPAQRPAGDALAQTLDVTPTIADLLGVPLGYRAEGRSAFSAAVARRRDVASPRATSARPSGISASAWIARRRAVVRRRCASSARGTGRACSQESARTATSSVATRPTGARPRRGPARASRSRGHSPTCGARPGGPGRDRGQRRGTPGRAARRRCCRERPHRGGWAKLQPHWRRHRALRGERPRAVAQGGGQPRGGVRGPWGRRLRPLARG